MITMRIWIAFFAGVAVALAVTTYVVYRTDVVQRHVCESSQKVRSPLLDYIDSTIPLYTASKKLQAAEAKLQPKASPELAMLERQLRHLQDTNFQQLIDLRAALGHAVATGCRE